MHIYLFMFSSAAYVRGRVHRVHQRSPCEKVQSCTVSANLLKSFRESCVSAFAEVFRKTLRFRRLLNIHDICRYRDMRLDLVRFWMPLYHDKS